MDGVDINQEFIPNLRERKWANAPFKKKNPAFCPFSQTN